MASIKAAELLRTEGNPQAASLGASGVFNYLLPKVNVVLQAAQAPDPNQQILLSRGSLEGDMRVREQNMKQEKLLNLLTDEARERETRRRAARDTSGSNSLLQSLLLDPQPSQPSPIYTGDAPKGDLLQDLPEIPLPEFNPSVANGSLLPPLEGEGAL